MKKTALFFLRFCVYLCVCLGLAVIGMAPAAFAQEKERVVSLAPNLTELMFALGAESFLVGRTTFATYPAQAENLPSVGTYYRPNVEAILALNPGIVLATPDGNPKPILESLEKLGIEVIRFNPTNFEELKGTLQTLGSRFGKEKNAAALSAHIDAQLALLEQQCGEKAGSKSHAGAVLLLQLSPPIAASDQSFVGEMPEFACLKNRIHAETLYPALTVEALLALEVDVLLLAGMDTRETTPGSPIPAVRKADAAQLADMQALWAGWESIPAVRNGQVYFLNPDIFTRPSLRLLDGLFALQKALP